MKKKKSKDPDKCESTSQNWQGGICIECGRRHVLVNGKKRK
jgi:hypothetical protein